MATPKTYLRKLLKDTFLWDRREKRKQLAKVESWAQQGRPVPPPDHVKRTTLAEYGLAFGPRVFIETGTFLGDTTYQMRRQFKTLFSIELSPELAANARVRFRRFPQIHIEEGDSGKLLPVILRDIAEPCLFWLDGHYSGGVTAQAELDTPIMGELRTIFDHPIKEHVILIDDARLFDGTHDYPTIDELRNFSAIERPSYEFSVVNDIIRIHPPRTVTTTY